VNLKKVKEFNIYNCYKTNAVLYYAAISWHCSLITDCCLYVDLISLSSECGQFGGWH